MHPAVARHGSDCEWRVTHPQTRVPALLDVPGRPAETEDQKFAQTFLGAREIVRRIHPAQHVVVRNLAVEGCHQPAEAILAYERIKILIVHVCNRDQYRTPQAGDPVLRRDNKGVR